MLAEVVASLDLPAEGLAGRIAAPPVKQALRASTEAALQAGVFGVPAFRLDRELFWGHDRMAQLAARLDGSLRGPDEGAAAMERRPRAADRRGAPLGKQPAPD